MFVGIEGLDGTGKSTIIPIIAQLLREQGLSVAIKPEFPEGKLDEELRAALTKGLFLAQHLQIPAAAAFFYLLYAELVSQEITPFDDHDIVLADRCHYTHAMYQAYFACKDPAAFDVVDVQARLEGLLSVLRVRLPDLVVMLEAPLEVVLPRLIEREGRPIKDEEVRVLQVFSECYARLAASHPQTVCRVDAIDPPRDVAVRAARLIIERYAMKRTS